MSGIEKIAAERQRQIEKEGWTAEHDDEHVNGELAMAAVCYAAPRLVYEKSQYSNGVSFSDVWPFDSGWDKRSVVNQGNVIKANDKIPDKKRIRLLVMAGALCAAEIDRLERKIKK